MTNDQTKTISLPWVSLTIFLAFQALIFITWAPLERGELNPALSAIGVVPLSVPYGDFRTISTGVQFHEQGGNPYEDGSYEIFGRKFNYPPIWLEMSFLGLSPLDVRYVYITFASLFGVSLGLLFWRDKNRVWYLYFPFVFSPPVFLALERCNNDLLMFFLIVFALWIGRKSIGGILDWLTGILLLLATVLKVFPVFAFYVFLKESWKRSLTLLVPFGICCAVYFATIRPILKMIHENTPLSAYVSFGVNVFPYFLSLRFADSALFQVSNLMLVAWGVAGVIIFLGYRLGKAGVDVEGMEGYDASLFRAGGAIYVATFLMGSNYDYRLIFLLLTVPFAFRMVKEGGVLNKWFVLHLVLLAIVYWVNEVSILFRQKDAFGNVALALNELSNWGLFFLNITFLFKMLPGFVREMIYKPSVGS